MIGKSLTSAAAGHRGRPRAARRVAHADAAPARGRWRRSGAPPAPTLLIGGTADSDHWDPAALPDNPAIDVLELEGLDHALQAEGDLGASLAALVKVTGSLAAFLDRSYS